MLTFVTIVVGMDRKFFLKCCIPQPDCLHSLLPAVKSNPYDHNFQLPVCNFNFRGNSFIRRNLYLFKLDFDCLFCLFL